MNKIQAEKIVIRSAEGLNAYVDTLPKEFIISQDAAEPDIMYFRANREIKDNLPNIVGPSDGAAKVDLKIVFTDGVEFDTTILVNKADKSTVRLIGRKILNSFSPEDMQFWAGYEFDGYNNTALRFNGWRN